MGGPFGLARTCPYTSMYIVWLISRLILQHYYHYTKPIIEEQIFVLKYYAFVVFLILFWCCYFKDVYVELKPQTYLVSHADEYTDRDFVV